MAYRKSFVLSDESINCYGFWILLSGMDLSGVQKNCPLYYEHRTWEIPCGHVENIKLKGSQVVGDIVIEGGNDIEREYIRKIENGDIKGCSFGIDPIEWTEDTTLLKQGQTRATLSKCKPFELSLAPLPGNGNALAMRNENNILTLNANQQYDFIPDLNTHINMKKIAVLLGMAETATEDQLCDAVKPLQLKAANADVYQKAFEETAGAHLPEAEKKFFVSLCKTNMPAAIEFLTLNKQPAATAPVVTETTTETEKTVIKKDVKIVDLIKKQDADGGAEDQKETFDYLQRHDSVKLAKIKQDEPEKYTKLVADYGKGVRYKA